MGVCLDAIHHQEEEENRQVCLSSSRNIVKGGGVDVLQNFQKKVQGDES